MPCTTYECVSACFSGNRDLSTSNLPMIGLSFRRRSGVITLDELVDRKTTLGLPDTSRWNIWYLSDECDNEDTSYALGILMFRSKRMHCEWIRLVFDSLLSNRLLPLLPNPFDVFPTGLRSLNT